MLIDLLRFGRRKQLAILELIGQRLYLLIDVGLSRAPFLCFNYLTCAVELAPKIFGKNFEEKGFENENDKVNFVFIRLKINKHPTNRPSARIIYFHLYSDSSYC